MTEGEFIRFYKKRNLSRSYKEVKEKIDIFWTVLLKALDEDGKVLLKDWGAFEKKEV
ncbi:HU family DNA-binding protein, partial [Fusobacterium varium]